MSSSECVKVVVRSRPLGQRELKIGCSVVVEMDPKRAQCSIRNPADKTGTTKLFTFDGAYDMNATTENMDKLALREIEDLQSEFERDRVDYLETIRRQNQQMKLYQQLLAKVKPCIRKDSNYADLESIKRAAVWDGDAQKWNLPEFLFFKTKLPKADSVNNLKSAPGTYFPYKHNTTWKHLQSGILYTDDLYDGRASQASNASRLTPTNIFKPPSSRTTP